VREQRSRCSKAQIKKSRCFRLEMYQKKLYSRKSFNPRHKQKLIMKIKELKLMKSLHYCTWM